MSTFVSVGNALQPFSRLLEGVSRIATQLPQPIVIQHGHTPFRNDVCKLVTFLSMHEFVERVHSADLLIMHAGAGSVMHAIEAGKIPVVMPRRAALGEHVNDHQMELAQALAEIDKIVMQDDPDNLLSSVKIAMSKQKLLRDKLADRIAPPPLVSLVAHVLDDYADQFSSERH